MWCSCEDCKTPSIALQKNSAADACYCRHCGTHPRRVQVLHLRLGQALADRLAAAQPLRARQVHQPQARLGHIPCIGCNVSSLQRAQGVQAKLSHNMGS